MNLDGLFNSSSCLSFCHSSGDWGGGGGEGEGRMSCTL